MCNIKLVQGDVEVRVFNQDVEVPRCLRIIWKNCKEIARSWNYCCSQIFREGSGIAAALSKNGRSLPFLARLVGYDLPKSVVWCTNIPT